MYLSFNEEEKYLISHIIYGYEPEERAKALKEWLLANKDIEEKNSYIENLSNGIRTTIETVNEDELRSYFANMDLSSLSSLLDDEEDQTYI